MHNFKYFLFRLLPVNIVFGIGWILWQILVDEIAGLIRERIPEGGVLMYAATHPSIIMPSLMVAISIVLYLRLRHNLKHEYSLDDALEMIECTTNLFEKLMATQQQTKIADIRSEINRQIRKCPDEWLRTGIRKFLDAVSETTRYGIKRESQTSQELLTEWSDRMSSYAYKHFRRAENGYQRIDNL